MTELPFSPFLQRCHMAFESPTDLFFVVDHVGGGDLFFHLVQRITEQGWGFSEGEARVLLSEAILALEHLHAHGMMHRDVKVRGCVCSFVFLSTTAGPPHKIKLIKNNDDAFPSTPFPLCCVLPPYRNNDDKIQEQVSVLIT
jgi:serine/threonine protein kinase